MYLETDEIRNLAGALKRRFPEIDRCAGFARRLGLTPPRAGQDAAAAWSDLLLEAQRRRVLGRLARLAALLEPDDENLQRICALIEAEAPASRLPVLLAAGATVLACSFAFFAGVQASSWLEPDPTVRTRGSDEGSVVRAAPVKLVREHAWQEAVALAAEPGAQPDPAEATEPPRVEVAAAAQPDGSLLQPQARQSTSSEPRKKGRCTAPGGGVVGYWYAGADLPGNAGDVIVMEHDANVRSQIPDWKTGWKLTGEVRCVLYAGDVVRLTRDPVPIPIDKYWIPLVSGDLVEDAATRASAEARPASAGTHEG